MTRKPIEEKALSPRARLFVDQYLVDLNAAKAAERAGYSAKTAMQLGGRLLKDPRVKAAIETAMAQRAERTKVSADRVLEEFWAIATADANELVEYRRTCCRHCYGKRFDYQYTARERAARYASWAKRKDARPTDVFDEGGGIGYDARRDPNPVCPECFGEGEGAAFFKDTRRLSDAARRLYAGVRITRDGIEVKAHDKTTALTQLGRHFGLFVDKIKVEDELSEEELEARVLGLMQRAAERKRASGG